MTGPYIAIVSAIIYCLIVLAIGYVSYLHTTKTTEDYFVASRSLGTLVVLMAIYATMMTSFYMLGVPGQAYIGGIPTYGFFAGVPIFATLFIYVIGYRSWLIAKKFKYYTQSEVVSERWGSPLVGTILFAVLIYYTLPYIITSAIGMGIAFEVLTEGLVPYAWGAAIPVVIVFFYTMIGGMRGTAWTNVFQGFVFIFVAFLAMFLVARHEGGVIALTQTMLREKPEFFSAAEMYTPKIWFSVLFAINASAVMIPQVFMRILTAKSASTLKRTFWLHALIAGVSWFPVVMLGVWGRFIIPDLTGRAVDNILPILLLNYFPGLLVGLALAGILAAIMSSMDAMLLSVSTMFVRDVMLRIFPGMEQQRQINWARIFVILIAVMAYIGALIRPGTIFLIIQYAFTGYCLTVPVMIAALYWRRSTKEAAIVSLLVPAILIPIYFFTDWLKWTTFGFLPVIPLLVITIALLIIVSKLTRETPLEHTNKFFDLFDSIYLKKKSRTDNFTRSV